MPTLPYHFRKFLSTIEPGPTRQEKAQDIPAQVRDFLKETSAIQTVDPHSRLAGSYARCTAIKDIKDVDIILFIASDYHEDCTPEEVLNLVFSSLSSLAEALEDQGEPSIQRHQRRSINVHLENADFDLDIVPAVALNGKNKPLRIPDKDWSKWVETDPLGYGDALSELNGEHEEKAVPLIKMLKHWRDVHMVYRRPKSYWLESLVYHKIKDGKVMTEGRSYAEIFADLLEAIYDGFKKKLDEAGAVPKIADPMLGHNIAHNWERDAFESFMRRIDESRKWSARALEQDEDEAVTLWQKVFGDEWFPATAEKRITGDMLRTARAAGMGIVTPAGKVLLEPSPERSVSIPPQRFYGGKRFNFIPVHRLSIGQQIAAMDALFPNFVYDRKNHRWIGSLQPTDTSPKYIVEIYYRERGVPQVWVVSPSLEHDAPHRYPDDGSLCLYFPPDRSWTSKAYIAKTIVPWTALWLLCYELWLESGKTEWYAPEAPHLLAKTR